MTVKSMVRSTACVLIHMIFVLAAWTLHGQVVITSSVVGSVDDPQQAIVPGAQVTLKNLDTGVETKAQTDSAGNYQFPNLIAGRYQVTVAQSGFALAVSTPVALENGISRRVNFTLKLGETTEVIYVTAAAATMATEDANVSEVIDNRQVNDMPVEGRNFLNYAQIVPMFTSGTGDTTRVAWGLASATSTGGKQLNVGGTEYGVGYYIDGLNNNDNWVEGPVMNVNMDAVQEVKAEITNYSAAYGRDVGQISLTTKSGTQELHGTVYNFFQNAGLNANDPYFKATHLPADWQRNAYHQNQYGFTAGGPVLLPRIFDGRKHKLFFFGSFEQMRNRGSSLATAELPTADEIKGDFSAWLTQFPVDVSQCDGTSNAPSNCRYVLYDPSTFNPATQTRRPYQNNIIPNPNPKALAYLSHFPAPNGYSSPLPGVFDNWKGHYTNGIDGNNYSARADYDVSEHDNLYFRWSYDYGTKISQGGVLPELTLGNGPVHTVDTYQWHEVHTFGPTLNNEVSFSITKAINRSEEPAAINKFMQASWFENLFQNTSSGGAGFSHADLSALGISTDGTYNLGINNFWALSQGPGEYWYQKVPIYQLEDNISKTLGRHSFKLGGYWSRRDEIDNDVIRSVSVGNSYTGRGPLSNDGSGWNGLAEFETGAITSMNQRTPLKSGDSALWFRMPEYGGYLNDTWSVSPKLTLSLGLRYDVAPPAFSVDSYWGVLDMKYPGYRLVMPGLTPGTDAKPYSADKNNFAPRLGIALRMRPDLVVRGGYGMFYETGRFKFLDQVFWNSPGYGGATYNSADYSSEKGGDPNQVYFTIDNVFPTAASVVKGDWPIPLGNMGGQLYQRQDATTVDSQSAIIPYIQRWSLDIQQQLGHNNVFSLGYLGSKGTKLTTQDDINLPPPGVYLNAEDFYQARPLSKQYPDRWGAIYAVHHDRNNNYNALTAQFKTQNWHGVNSQIGYTWSKQLDTFFGENGESGTNAGIGGEWHRNWAYGPSDADHPHRLVGMVLYAIPVPHLSNHLLRESLNGWQLNTIATFETGSPFTVWNGYTSSFDYMGDVPNRVCNGNLSRSSRSFTRAFDTNCFVEPNPDPVTQVALFRGNERRNSLHGPGTNNWDTSIEKSFNLYREGPRLQLRAESFNTFNHTQWSSVNSWDDRAINDQSQFGYVTGGRPGRHMQVAAKFIF